MNKQFKVGDVVVRINCDNGGNARIGQLAHVVALDGDGSPFVEYEGRDGDNGGELWYHANAQLVPWRACEVVPGTTYKDREGREYREYRFVAYVEDDTIGIFLTQCNSAVLRQADGKLLNNPLREILPQQSNSHDRCLPNW